VSTCRRPLSNVSLVLAVLRSNQGGRPLSLQEIAKAVADLGGLEIAPTAVKRAIQELRRQGCRIETRRRYQAKTVDYTLLPD
jgi:biotin operon repressor